MLDSLPQSATQKMLAHSSARNATKRRIGFPQLLTLRLQPLVNKPEIL